MLNFKEWLLNEDLNYLDKIKPEEYMKMLLADPKGKSFIDSLKKTESKFLVVQLLEDPLGLYKKTTTRSVSAQDSEKYEKLIKQEVMPYLESKNNYVKGFEKDIWLFLDPQIPMLQKIVPDTLKNATYKDMARFWNSKEIGGHSDTDEKLYVAFDVFDPNASKAYQSLIDYYIANPELFRNAKIPTVANRHENFIYYFSYQGERKKTKVENDVKSMLSSLKIEPTLQQGSDYGDKSGNEVKVAKLNLQLFLPLMNKNQLEILTKTWEGFFKKNPRKLYNQSPWVVAYRLIHADPKLKAIFTRNGFDIDLENIAKNPETPPNNSEKPNQNQTDDKPTTNQANGNLTLIPTETNKPIPVSIDATLGNTIINTPNAQKFMSQKQFILKKVNGIWTIAQSPEAKNSTNINGKPIGFNPQPLNNGDTISLGKTGQVPIKVSFN